jgi:hypothetical protein
MLLVRVWFCTHVGYFLIAVGFEIKLLRVLPISALLCLTPLPPVPQPKHYCSLKDACNQRLSKYVCPVVGTVIATT